MTVKESEDRLAGAKAQGQAQFDSIREMVEEMQRAQAAFDERETNEGPLGHLYKPIEEARERIQEDALSVEVRSGWHRPGDMADPCYTACEYKILLCTGGPACQIVGELGEHGEPETARLQVQDWFTPWTDYRPYSNANEPTCDPEQIMLEYARCFYFGE